MQCQHQASALPHQVQGRQAQLTKTLAWHRATHSWAVSDSNSTQCCQSHLLSIQYTVQPTAIWTRPSQNKPTTQAASHQRGSLRRCMPAMAMSAPAALSNATPAPTHTEKLLLVVGVALIDPHSAGGPRVLLAQRPPGKANAGLWEFPGGKVDAGETPEGALVRELQEELGLTVQPGDLVPLSFVSWPYPTFHLFMPLYTCNRWQGEAHGKEGQAVVWATHEQLSSYPLTPADVPLLPAVMRTLQDTAAEVAV